jgi:hypothetical protein
MLVNHIFKKFAISGLSEKLSLQIRIIFPKQLEPD